MVRLGQRTIELSELNDAYPGVICMSEIRFWVQGGAIGDRIRLVDEDNKDVAGYVLTATSENGVLISQPTAFRGVRVASVPGGTVSIMIHIR